LVTAANAFFIAPVTVALAFAAVEGCFADFALLPRLVDRDAAARAALRLRAAFATRLGPRAACLRLAVFAFRLPAVFRLAAFGFRPPAVRVRLPVFFLATTPPDASDVARYDAGACKTGDELAPVAPHHL
jgi:hypothetical protein